jgi:hypothetical protein
LVGVTVSVVGVVVIAAGAFFFLKMHHHSTPTASATAPSTPKATPSTKSSSTGTATASGPFKLIAPASAGGYKAVAGFPSTQATEAETVAATTKEQLEQLGAGTVTSTVASAYLINKNLAAAYTGFNGTFNPELIAKSFGSEATDATTIDPGSHGGDMGCGTLSGATLCVWVTGKTLGMIEFFDGSGPTTVDSAAAAAYAMNIRSSVEVSAG